LLFGEDLRGESVCKNPCSGIERRRTLGFCERHGGRTKKGYPLGKGGGTEKRVQTLPPERNSWTFIHGSIKIINQGRTKRETLFGKRLRGYGATKVNRDAKEKLTL